MLYRKSTKDIPATWCTESSCALLLSSPTWSNVTLVILSYVLSVKMSFDDEGVSYEQLSWVENTKKERIAQGKRLYRHYAAVARATRPGRGPLQLRFGIGTRHEECYADFALSCLFRANFCERVLPDKPFRRTRLGQRVSMKGTCHHMFKPSVAPLTLRGCYEFELLLFWM